MFGLFRKKEPTVQVHDKIWMSTQAKWKACAHLYRQQPQTHFLSWFEESRNSLRDYFTAQGLDQAPITLTTAHIGSTDKQLVFIEHFPLQEEEQTTFKAMGLKEATVFSALDEPLFRLFKGERMIQLMQQMGMQPEECIENNMISAAIKRAQEKIRDKAMILTSARSQSDWLINAGVDNAS